MFLRRLLYALAFILIVSLLTSPSYAQETTAGLQGTVKDPTGAVIQGAIVEVSGAALIGTKKQQSDPGGYYRFANLPPGEYTLVVTSPNFRGSKLDGIKLEVGKLPTIDVVLQLGMTTEVVEVSSAAPMVDVTQSKISTVATDQIIAGVPKGRSFQSMITFAPGARQEPLQGGWQVDGASNSENSYLIEGQETGDVQSGASNTNAPFEFIKEVQVKSSGFEAEFGGALGGVVNVIQQRGSNSWHGSVLAYYQSSMFNPAPRSFLRFDQDPNAPVDPKTGYTVAQYYQPKKDSWRIVEPGFEVGGYLLKDRVWLFSSFVPRISTLNRTVNFLSTDESGNTFGVRTIPQDTQTYHALNRFDVLATQKIRLYGAWQYGYERGNGTTFSGGSNIPQADSAFGQYNEAAYNNPDNYRSSIGYTAPRVIYNTGADITLTPNLVATSRFGYFFSDAQDKGMPSLVRYEWRNTNYPFPNSPSTTSEGTTAALDGTLLGDVAPTMAHNAGYRSAALNLARMYNKYSRHSFTQDLAYFHKALGTHNLKVGYGFNRLANNTVQGYNTADVRVAFNTALSVLPGNQSVCSTIRSQNLAQFGQTGSTDNTSCRGNWGTYAIYEYGTTGKASSFNHSIYGQDAWTLGNTGVTLNLGVRFDSESLPSFSKNAKDISFGFTQKAAPRLGASWDVLKNGKLKIFGSYGMFYDIMKYEMPRGSFGGDYWHVCTYTLDDPDVSKINPTRGPDGHYCPSTGEALGTVTGRFIQNNDFRIPSNSPEDYRIDPNLKPMRQNAIDIGADFSINSEWALATRYTRKRLDRTIEDSGLLTSQGEVFYIVNPGEGINRLVGPDCPNCPTNVKPSRRYDGVEFRLTKRASGKWFGTFSYTFSRLRGNYSGLTATDVSDGGGARQSPNVDRAFDEPYMLFDSNGKAVDGPLATDRPHSFKAFGYYRLKWWKFETLLGGSQMWSSGSPISSFMSVAGAPVFVENRGKFVDVTVDPNTGLWTLGSVRERRTPTFSQTDLNLIHEFKFNPKNEAERIAFEVNITNVFNQRSIISYGQDLLAYGDTNLPELNGFADYHSYMTGYNFINAANDNGAVLNSLYGKPDWWQDGRSFRFKLKFSF